MQKAAQALQTAAPEYLPLKACQLPHLYSAVFKGRSLCEWREWQSHGKVAVISVRFYLFMKVSLQISHQNRPEKAVVPNTELH